MVDDACGGKYQQPSEDISAVQHCPARAAMDVPHRATERPPLPEQEEKRDAADQNISAALDDWRNDSCNNPLETGASHDAMLQREERKQAEVDHQSGGQRAGRG